MNPTAPNANDLLMGGSGSSIPSLKVGPGKITDPAPHSQPGEFKGGRIVAEAEPFPVMKRGDRGEITNEQATFPSGDPIWGVVVTVQTDDRDPNIEGDDGKRRIFIDGSVGKDDRLFNSRRRAVRDAVMEAGADGLRVGGDLRIAWTRRVDTGGSIPATDWVARYTSPANGLLGVPGAAAPVYQQPAPTPPPAAVPPVQQFTPEQIAAMQAAGIDTSAFAPPNAA